VRGKQYASGQLNVLEAGCGCGLGLIATARQQQDVHFTGVDINPVAIAQATEQVETEGLQNIHFYSADLMDPDAIEMPPAGFELIYSFGVLHHLSKPVTGLQNLKRLLARQGVMVCMLYGRYGREPLQRLVEAINLMTAPSLTVQQRMQPARQLAEVADHYLFKGTVWEETSLVDEIEFADRCLHIHERSYDIDSLWNLLQESGLRFVDWLEPDDWSVEWFKQEPLRSRVNALNVKDRFKLIERLCYRPRLELLISHSEK
jgi:SAM-dependent methyltransferase